MSEQHIDKEPSLDLPKPQTEQRTERGEADDSYSSGERDRAASIEAGATGTPAPIAPPQQQADDDGATTGPPNDLGATYDLPAIADDIDLIEREWVHKAKEIVEQTRDNPYRQTKEINKVKADYIKKRYNKDLQLEEN